MKLLSINLIFCSLLLLCSLIFFYWFSSYWIICCYQWWQASSSNEFENIFSLCCMLLVGWFSTILSGLSCYSFTFNLLHIIFNYWAVIFIFQRNIYFFISKRPFTLLLKQASPFLRIWWVHSLSMQHDGFERCPLHQWTFLPFWVFFFNFIVPNFYVFRYCPSSQ